MVHNLKLYEKRPIYETNIWRSFCREHVAKTKNLKIDLVHLLPIQTLLTNQENIGLHFTSTWMTAWNIWLYGLTPKSKHFKNFLKLNSNKISWNFVPLQGPFSSVCGQYCLFYLLHRSRKWTMQEICGFFTRDDKNSNDFLVNEFISEHSIWIHKYQILSLCWNRFSRALLKS